MLQYNSTPFPPTSLASLLDMLWEYPFTLPFPSHHIYFDFYHHVSQTDTLTLTLASGTYSGANNTNQVFNLQQYDIVGPASGPKAIIDCGSSVSGFQLNPKVTLVIYSISSIHSTIIHKTLHTTHTRISK